MSISLEHLADGDWQGLRRVIDVLMKLVIDTGGQTVGVRFGVSSVTFTASNVSAAHAGILHGLATTPVVVIATARDPIVNIGCNGRSATALQFQGTCVTAPITATITLDWVAIG